MIPEILGAFTSLQKIAALLERVAGALEQSNKLNHIRATAELRQKGKKAMSVEEYDELSEDLNNLMHNA